MAEKEINYFINRIICGDCRDLPKELPDNSIDAMVTDPPYEIGFMNKGFDKTGISFRKETWVETLRVLKPGAHALVFGSTRTYHRMVCALEDAGFEIRDTITWLYGSGFPKNYNISKGIDKAAPRRDMFAGFAAHFKARREASELSQKDIARHFPSKTGGITGCVWNWENGQCVPTPEQWDILQPILDLSIGYLPLIKRVEAQRQIVGKDGRKANDSIFHIGIQDEWDLTKPNTALAKKWQGWGTALKPACELICLARKPLSERNIVENVLKYGTGGMNIDGSRIGTKETCARKPARLKPGAIGYLRNDEPLFGGRGSSQGRWPANLILDEEAAALLDEQSGQVGGGHWSYKPPENGGLLKFGLKELPDKGHDKKLKGASRFFYCAKASRRERNMGLEGMAKKFLKTMSDGIGNREHNPKEPSAWVRNNHPTVKPLKLMEYLVNLITPPNGIVLDPFIGSGTTAMACKKLGFDYIGLEKEADYVEIAKARVAAVEQGLFK